MLIVESPDAIDERQESPVAVINGSWITLASAAWTAWLNEEAPARWTVEEEKS